MSLPVLVVLVVVGIAAIVLAVHLTGGTRDASLADEAEARERFAVDHPREHPTAVRLTMAGEAAFLELDRGRTGIVRSFGDRFLTRIVTSADIERVDRSAPDQVAIAFRDFTWRGGRFAFASAEDAGRIAGRLAPPVAAKRRSA
ncbi:MAG: hypothetical protein ACK4U0_20460 [Mesorhizobium sp.]